MANSYSLKHIIQLLSQLIETPSLSREEEGTASILEEFMQAQGVAYQQQGNNIWAWNKHRESDNPTILLNSHHDTVKAGSSWTYKPFKATLEGDKLTGLGSNDAGGCLVSLIATFLHFYEREDLPYNLVLAATAEEEISGPNGIASILGELGHIDLAIVGEPTQMQMAIAEKGLMVLDCYAHGKTGHAARDEGINAIYIALQDIEWFKSYQFEKTSPFLGPMKMTVSQIEAGHQHNVVPDLCKFVVDVRTNECYSNEAAFEIIGAATQSEIKPRSFRLNSSQLASDHPLVVKGKAMGLTTYGSPTLSDQALIPFPSLKIGPGDSARSHTPDEYILVSEIEGGIKVYVELLEGLSI